MKVIGVIPARYNSTRLPGKPLADICGKPMIWWVYQQAKKVRELYEVYVATDDERIMSVCENYNMPVLMTSYDAPNHIHRIWEVSEIREADYYVSINGDEPLIAVSDIQTAITAIPVEKLDIPYFGSVYRVLSDPAETIDLANVKIVLGENGRCLYQSRNPIPSTKGSLDIKYKKAIGIECFNKKALDFFVSTPPGVLEKAEDIDHLRFLEYGVPIYYTEVNSESLSVDTQKDLERVRQILLQVQGTNDLIGDSK